MPTAAPLPGWDGADILCQVQPCTNRLGVSAFMVYVIKIELTQYVIAYITLEAEKLFT